MKALFSSLLSLFFLIQFSYCADVSESFRVWTNSAGKTIKAKLISYDAKSVTINNGKKNYTLSLDTISEKDKEYLEQVKSSFNYQHLIITNKKLASEKLSPNLHDLAKRRSKEGLKSKIITLAEIRKNESLKEFKKLPEKIQEYIKKEHNESGVEYVFLCGDFSVIPVITELPEFLADTDLELARKEFGESMNGVPSDYHYACFDLNEGGNTPQVHVGRLPTSSDSELENYLSKVFEYEDRESSPVFSKALIFTAKQDGIGTNYGNAIKNELVSSGVGEEHFVSSHEERSELLKKFKENRFGFTFAAGHGEHGDLCSFFPDDFSKFTGEDYHTFVLSTLACHSGDIAVKSIATDLMCAHPKFGAVAAFMNSRVGFGGKFGQNKIQSLERIARFKKDLKRVGEISSFSRKEMSEVSHSSDLELQSKWFTTLEHNLLGDPALIWRTE